MDLTHIVDTLIGILVMADGFYIRSQSSEIKRLDLLLQDTRVIYATRSDMRDDMNAIHGSLQRLEDKLDRALARE
jgi:hypothetical protein